MMAADRDALLCDLAETYHVYDFRALPALTLAALCCGLRNDSRIRQKMAGVQISRLEALMVIADNLTIIRHGLFAKKGAEMPPLFADQIPDGNETFGFASGEDFMKARNDLLKRAQYV